MALLPQPFLKIGPYEIAYDEDAPYNPDESEVQEYIDKLLELKEAVQDLPDDIFNLSDMRRILQISNDFDD